MRLENSEFIAALPAGKRLMALDVGEKTIGLALSDLRRSIATPHFTIERTKWSKDGEAMLAVLSKEDVCGLVIGYPINADGSEGPRCQSTRGLARNLEKLTTLPMTFWDERLSTMAVEKAMLEADLSRARRAELVDKMAAAYMLQGFLDFMNI